LTSAFIGLFFAIGIAAIYYLLMHRVTEHSTPSTHATVVTPPQSVFIHPLQKQVLAALAKNTLLVTKQKIPGTYSSLDGAIAAAKNDTRIEVIDAEWNEGLNLKAGMFYPLDMTIVGNAPGGKPVVWKGQNPLVPIISMQSRRGLSLENFEFDGSNNIQCGIHIATGGLRVFNCFFQGFTVCAVQFVGASDEPTFSVIERCRFVASTPTKSAIRILATLPTQATVNPKILDNRFEGSFQKALDVDGIVHGLEFSRNRIHGCTTGVSFCIDSIPNLPKDPVPVISISANIHRNTFANLEAAIRYDFAFTVKSSAVHIDGNAFLGIPKAVEWPGQAINPAVEPSALAVLKYGPNNAFLDMATMDSAPLSMGKLVKAGIATDPADDKTFLRVLDPGATFGVPPETPVLKVNGN
jgi:hypothetical protein